MFTENSDTPAEGTLRCSACGQSHSGEHTCPEAPEDWYEAEDTLRAEKSNGVYLLSVRRVSNATEWDRVVTSSHEEKQIKKVRINGHYVGFDERIEFECDDFELEDGVLNVVMDS